MLGAVIAERAHYVAAEEIRYVAHSISLEDQAIRMQALPGATPLHLDEAEALLPSHITMQRELNAWE